MSSFRDERFLSAGAAEEGVRVPLRTRDDYPTEEWIEVRGAESRVWRDADERAARAIRTRLAPAPGAVLSDAAREAVLAEETLRVSVAAVKAWSFAEPCTPEAVAELLRGAPYIRDQVDRACQDRALFFGLRSASLVSGALATSSLSDAPAEAPPSESSEST